MSDTNKEAQEVLEEHKLAQPIDGEIEVIPQNGDETEAVEESIEEGLPVPPVTIHILAPGHARTLPKSLGPQPTLTLLPQPHETIQELKLAVNECLAGYWLGPYSLRIPAGKGKKGGEKVKPKQAAERESAVIGEGDRLSEWLEVGDVFAGFDDKEERVLEVVREPYTDFSARQTVLRLLELISPVGSSTHTLANPIALDPGASIFEAVRDGTATEPTYQEVEVALAGKKSKGKKEVVKVKKEAAHAFADWTDVWPEAELGRLPVTQGPIEAQSCLKNIQISPFNPPAPHLRQKGHQLYLQVSTLEGETSTLICASRGWYVSRSNVNTFDPTPRSETASLYSHSLIDLLHSISPLFTERLSQLSPLSGTAPALEPITTVPIPQAEPAYPFLTTPPKPASVADVVRSQLAYIHTGALSPDGLDGARDWNEEIQGIKELPKESMQERVFREKLGQKTWSEFTAASVRCVLAVARGDVPPLNPNEDARAHMFLASNIFITKAVDSIAAYSHVGGDAAAHVSHAKDAAGVKLLNKLDIDGAHLLGHTVVDWAGERWVCQSMLPGIFSRSRVEEDVEEETKPQADDIAKEDGEAKKEDWVEVNGSPTKSVGKADEEEKTATEKVDNGVEEIPENPLIIYGLDSEHLTSIHWDAATHKVMAKIATAQRLAAHKMKDGKGQDFEFYASNEVKGLRGTDGRRYLLDLPRMSPVDVEWLQKDIDGKLVGSEETGPQYPHRIVLLRPELVEAFWESELKRWAREVAAKKAQGAAVEGKPKEDVETSPAKEEEDVSEETAALGDDASPAATAAAVQRAEADAPLDTTLDPSSLASFNLRLNPDAFVDLTPAKGADPTAFVPSTITDESDPTIKAVRDASVFLRTVAIPAVVLDVLTGNTSGIMDGASLSKHLHGRGINIRYLGYLASTIDSFAAGPDGEKRESGHLAALKGVVVQEMIFRSAKHVLKSFLVGLQPEHIPCAVSHFLNCLLGTSRNASPEAIYSPIDLGGVEVEPAYVKATPESIRKTIVDGVKTRFRWTLVDNDLELGLRKKQLLRELAMRVGFQLLQKSYRFDSATAEQVVSDDDKVNKVSGGKDKKDKKTKKRRNEEVTVSNTTFQPSDILSLIPIVRSTAPSCSVAEEIFDAGRATINRGSIDLGLEFLLEAVQLYENIHSVIHPEVAAAYNQYSSTIHQLARLKMQQMATENADPEQPLGLDVATALRLQRQAVIIAERTLGVYHPETSAYYFNLAMLENLEGNGQSSLKYFRHVISLWDVIHGPGHPEINTVLSNAGVVLQTLSEHSLSLSLLLSASKSTSELFGPEHIQTAQSLHQLTQAHFLAGDILAALVASEQSLVIFEKRLGAEHGTTKEVLKNVLLLRAVVENERQKAAGAQAREKQLERLQATQVRVGGPSSRRRIVGDLPTAGSSSRSALGSAASAQTNGDALADAAVDSRIGKRGHLDVDELVKFIQGGPSEGSPRGKNTLRGKRRTGAKR